MLLIINFIIGPRRGKIRTPLRKKQKTTVTDDYYDIHEVADLDRKAQAEEAPEETSPNNT